jgi:hypothetical protein
MQILEQLLVIADPEHEVEELLAPRPHRALDPGRADRRAAHGELHVLLQVPAEILVIRLGEEGREGPLWAGVGARRGHKPIGQGVAAPVEEDA